MSSTDQPIAENEQVKELLALLQKNKTPGYEDFVQMIGLPRLAVKKYQTGGIYLNP